MAHGYETPATFEPDDATDLKTSNGPLSVSSATVNPALSSAPTLEQSFEVFNVLKIAVELASWSARSVK